MSQAIAYYNGQFIELHQAVVPIEERGLQFGDGVYEVIRIYRGVPFTAREHLNRLEQSAKAILLELPKRMEELLSI
ncbi:MAG: aminotransferase class IV, partial [Clostridia bacterium]